MSGPRDLRPLFDPRSIAVVGASDDSRKWGHWLALRALRGEHRRQVHLVNRGGGEVLRRPACRSLAELPGEAELVVVAVPAPALEATVEEALLAGARAIVAITAGTAGDPREAALAAAVREAGAVLLGPNCLGVFDAAAELELVSNDFPAGTVGLVSQSGNLALEIGLLAREADLGFSRFVSLGNQADLEAADLIEALARHEATEAIMLYIEDFRDGRAFARAAAAARDRGKPVVLLSLDRTEATARAASSHTGALASDSAAVRAACAAAGIQLVRTPQELVDLVQGVIRGAAPRGRRLAVLSDGGGHGAIAASLAASRGLRVPELGAATVAALQAELPVVAACSNPIDLAGGAEQDIATFERAAALVLRCTEVDALLMTGYFGGYAEYGGAAGEAEVAVADALARTAAQTTTTLIVQTMFPNTPAAEALRRGGVATYKTIEQAIAVLARLAADEQHAPRPIPELPAPAAPLADGYDGVRGLLADAGLPFAAQETVCTLPEARLAAQRIGYPVVLKALGMLHKSDAGGVALDLRDERALSDAFAAIEERLAPSAFSVEQMAPLGEGIELLLGVRWDERFGPVALAGIGGIYTEVLRDFAMALAPVAVPEAVTMLTELRGWPLLQGIRGRPALDVQAAAHALATLSAVAATHPEIAELEVNPLLVLPRGVLALDARAVSAPMAEEVIA